MLHYTTTYCSVAHILGRVEEPRQEYSIRGVVVRRIDVNTQGIPKYIYNESIIFGEIVHDLVLRKAQKPS